MNDWQDWERYLRIALIGSAFEPLHGIGDFLLQNGFIAYNKRDRFEVAFLHGLLYTLPFALFLYSLPKRLQPKDLELKLAIICLTHVAIDYWAIASVWCRFYNWDWDTAPQEMKTPRFVMIEVDQAMHKAINQAVLWF